jgi:hypothetical protein
MINVANVFEKIPIGSSNILWLNPMVEFQKFYLIFQFMQVVFKTVVLECFFCER